MVRKILSAVLLVAIGLTTVVSLCDTDTEAVLVREKRKKCELPDWPKKFRRRLMKEFGDNVERYFLDRIVFRDQWFDLASMLPRINDNVVYVQGEGDWLYLGNKYNHYVDRLNGKEVDTKKSVAEKAAIFKGFKEVCDRHGIEFYVMVGPNKANVYPEYLPKFVIPAPKRYSEPLMDAIREAGVNLYDPTETLKANKDKGYMYWRMDVHWNQLGAYYAAKGVLEFMGLPTLPPCIARVEGVHEGDIYDVSGRFDLPPATGDNYVIEWPEDAPEKLGDTKIHILGDSFSTEPMARIKRFYPNVTWCHYGRALPLPRNQRDKLPIALDNYLRSLPEKPEKLLWIHVERFFSEGYFRSPAMEADGQE